MESDLISDTWGDLDSAELRLLLDERIGGPGQYDDPDKNPNVIYLPLGGASCRIKLTLRDKKIAAIERGPAFDAAEWERVSQEIERSILAGPMKVGRDFSFSSFRVLGSWRGNQSGVQILPPPDGTPRAPDEMAEHPFVLEFPLRASDLWQITNHRRIREHRRLTLLFNILLRGRTSLQPRRADQFWASVPRNDGGRDIKWVRQFFLGELGEVIQDRLSMPANEQLEELEPKAYYAQVGHDGRGLRVPADLDESIYCYRQLSADNRDKFDRATFWMDMASRQWNMSMSASFAALVSAISSLLEPGELQRFKRPFHAGSQHEVSQAMEEFEVFFEKYGGQASSGDRRREMYSFWSKIIRGSELMQLDQLDLDFAFGWDPPWWKERELYNELWSLARAALRNWLRNPPH